MQHEGSGIVNLINEIVVIKTVLMDVVHCSSLLRPPHFISWMYFHNQVTKNHSVWAKGTDAKKSLPHHHRNRAILQNALVLEN